MIESAAAVSQDLTLLLPEIWLSYHPPRSFLPTINATIKALKALHQTSAGLHTQALQQLLLASLQLLSSDPPLKHQTSEGIHRIGDLFHPHGLPMNPPHTILSISDH